VSEEITVLVNTLRELAAICAAIAQGKLELKGPGLPGACDEDQASIDALFRDN